MTATQKAPPAAGRDIATARMVLATDLDGTFLGGSAAERDRLYRWVEANRAAVGLVFVTGRDPAFIEELCSETAVPWPEFVIGDVGTTIAKVDPDRRLRPIKPLEQEIARRWGDSGAAVRAALDGHPGLALQPTAFRYRVSFDLDPEAFCPSAGEKVAGLGLDVLTSDNRFLDVLPRGVSKGPSLRRLIAHLGIAEERVLVAGDTLNDLSMLASGLSAVAVGGSEPALIERLAGAERVHFAEAAGAAGILEAIGAFGFFKSSKEFAHAV